MEKEEAEKLHFTVEQILQLTHKHFPLDVIKFNGFALGIHSLPNLQIFSNLQVISLSLNYLITLQPFQSCYLLQELHLRKNFISNLEEIFYLLRLPSLHTFLLSDNPCCKTLFYRLKVIRILKTLKVFDSSGITEEEKKLSHENRQELIDFEYKVFLYDQQQEPHDHDQEEEEVVEENEVEEEEDDNHDDKSDPEVEDEGNEIQNDQNEIIYKSYHGTNSPSLLSSSNLASPPPPLPPPSSSLSSFPPTISTPKHYSNILLASKLLLIDMSIDEVKQLMTWCQEKINEVE